MFGLFGSGKAYKDQQHQYNKYMNQANQAQQPWMQAGQQAIPQYQNWLQGQQDPSGFINNLMGQYQESPYAKYLQQQSMNAGQNEASASGLMGSTPLIQQMQQNAGNISSGDMGSWLQNVLGINSNYGTGQNNLMQGGQNAANALSGNYTNQANENGRLAYNQTRGRQNDWGNLVGSIAGMFL